MTSASVPAGPPVLALRGVSKRFGAVEALVDVDLDVQEGEVVALVGDNGAGKSTLVKVVSGVHCRDGGALAVDGRPADVGGPQEAAALGIATVYQDLALCDNLDVVANVFLGRELVARWGRRSGVLDDVKMEERTLSLLASLGVTLPDVRAPVVSLSGGQRQSVSIARSLLGTPRLVVLDEPTAALGVTQTAQVLALVVRLREQGVGVLVISHNLDDVFAVADRIAVLRLGRNAGSFDAGTSTQAEVVAAMTGSGRDGLADPAAGPSEARG
jgi:D-xylose transport system ATP-binding protein